MNINKLAQAVIHRGVVPAAGGAASAFANKIVPGMNPKLRAILKIGLGAIIPEFIPKNKMVEGIGQGFSGAAGSELAQEFIPTLKETTVPATAGIGNDVAYITDSDVISGADDVVIEGADDVVIEGADDVVSGISGDDEEIAKMQEQGLI